MKLCIHLTTLLLGSLSNFKAIRTSHPQSCRFKTLWDLTIRCLIGCVNGALVPLDIYLMIHKYSVWIYSAFNLVSANPHQKCPTCLIIFADTVFMSYDQVEVSGVSLHYHNLGQSWRQKYIRMWLVTYHFPLTTAAVDKNNNICSSVLCNLVYSFEIILSNL